MKNGNDISGIHNGSFTNGPKAIPAIQEIPI